MKKTAIIYWAPRILGILSILFISVFALDVFQAGVPLTSMLLGLTVHLMPSIVLAVFLAIAWRYPRTGGVLFLLTSLLPFLLLSNLFWVNVMLAAPFFLTAVLFFYSTKEQ